MIIIIITIIMILCVCIYIYMRIDMYIYIYIWPGVVLQLERLLGNGFPEGRPVYNVMLD